MKIRFACLSCVLIAVLTSGGVGAAQRSFVSTDGVDNPACSLTSPCRSFGAAIAVTSSGGEVIVLNSGGYGKVTITQAVSIIAPPGIYAGISVFPADDGVTVSAGATDKVVLRGLTINGLGGNNGVRITSGQETHVEDCTISNLGADGIRVEGGGRTHVTRTVARSNAGVGLHLVSGTPAVYVTGSRFAENSDGIVNEAGDLFGSGVTMENNAGDGIRSAPGAASITISSALADSVSIGNGGAGFAVDANQASSTIHASAARVTIARNAASGFEADTFQGVATLTVSDSVSIENGVFGLFVSGSITATVTGSTLARNVNADLAQAAGAVLRTSANNTVTGRGAPDIFGSLTPNPLK